MQVLRPCWPKLQAGYPCKRISRDCVTDRRIALHAAIARPCSSTTLKIVCLCLPGACAPVLSTPSRASSIVPYNLSMMLTIPVCSAGVGCKFAISDVTSVLPTGKEGNRRVRPCGDFSYKIAAGRCLGGQPQQRRSCIVCSSSREGAEGPLKEVRRDVLIAGHCRSMSQFPDCSGVELL